MSEHTFGEAPASVNFRFYLADYECQLTLRNETGLELLAKLQAAIKAVEGLGGVSVEVWHAQRRTAQQQQPATTTAPAPTNGDANAPTCPVHHAPMLASKRGGWYCPVKIAEDGGDGKPTYCKAKAK